MTTRIRRLTLRTVALGVTALALTVGGAGATAGLEAAADDGVIKAVPAQVRRPADPVRREDVQAVGAGAELEREGSGRAGRACRRRRQGRGSRACRREG